ncbi:182 kDa tankyrase-1-binding protein [Podargus strigoides]
MWAGAAVTPVPPPGESRERRWQRRETRGDGADPALPLPTPGVTMASQPQPLCPAVPCASPTGTGGAGLVPGTPEKGVARPKPPVRPKPRVLPKPAVPAKPCPPQTPPAPRPPRPELPSAEKMNRLAGPQPYGGGGSGGPLRRPSFTLRSPETPNGKGLPSPPTAATEDLGSAPGGEAPPAPLTPSRKGPAPFKVTPVLMGAKAERFPGTTVEEILARLGSRGGTGSPDPASRFGSKPFAAFRSRPSAEADGAPPAEAPQTPPPTVGKLGPGDDGHPVAQTSGSPPAGPRCAGDPRGRRRPPSPPDLSSLQLGVLGPPGSPRPPACPAPGAPAEPPAPGSPDAPPAPGSPESPPQPPAEVSATPIQAPGAPFSVAEPWPSISCSPGSPHAPGEGSPATASPPGTPQLPPRVTCPPGSPEAAAECLVPPSLSPEPPNTSRPPGSPEGPDDSLLSPQPPKGPDFSPVPPSRVGGLQCPSEGMLQTVGGLGGSLSALSPPGDPLPEASPDSDSSQSLSLSVEEALPSWGAQQLVVPPRKMAGLGLSEEVELDGWDPSPRSRGDSGSEGPGPAVGKEGAPCPGGPVAQPESEGSAEEEEGEAERGATVSHSPLCVMEPGQDPAEPEPHIRVAPPDPAPMANLAEAPASEGPVGLQGPGGPGRAEGPSGDSDPHADPGWLMELLSSPGPHTTGHGSPEGLLGWSRKDLHREFGVGGHQAGTFVWTRKAVASETDWAAGTEWDQELRTKSGWDSIPGDGDRDGERPAGPFSSTQGDWGSSYRGMELVGKTGLGCSDWSSPRGAAGRVLQDPDFGTSEPRWGAGYGLAGAGNGEEMNSGDGAWGGCCSMEHGRRQDEGLGSRQPRWAGGYGTGDAGVKDGELPTGWAGEFSSRDGEGKEKDFTLGWAGRSSTGDTGTPDRELSPSWHGKHRSGDMERQDREFSPSRPAWTGEGSAQDMEKQNREFSPGRPAWHSRHCSRDTESQDGDLSPSRPTWDSECCSRDTESQELEFSPGWDSECHSRGMEHQDPECGPSWDSKRCSGDVEHQDPEFGPSWDSKRRSGDMEHQDPEFGPSWDSKRRSGDMEHQDPEFGPSWDSKRHSGDMEHQDPEFGPSWDSKRHSGDMEHQDPEFGPSWDSKRRSGDMEHQDPEFRPGRVAEAGECSTGAMETQDGDLSPSRTSQDDGHSSRETETRESRFSPMGVPWEDGHSSKDVEIQAGELGSGRAAWASEFGFVASEEEGREARRGEVVPGRQSWAGERGAGQTPLDLPGCHGPEPLAQEPSWGSRGQQEHSATNSRDWAEELGGAERRNQFGVIGTERVSDPSSTGAAPDASVSWADGPQAGGLLEPLGGWHGDLSLGSSGAGGTELGQGGWGLGCGRDPDPDPDGAGWSVELHDAEAKRREWASAFGARRAARSRDFSAGEQSLGDAAGSADGSIDPLGPSPPMGDALAAPPAVEPPQSEPPSPTEEESDLLEPAHALWSPGAPPVLPEAAGGSLPEARSEGDPSDHLDGRRPPSWEEQRLSLGSPQPQGPLDHAGQEFAFLEDTEVLDSSVYRSKASLGRKRRHRAPALRPAAASDCDSWIFRDSTEPRPAPPATSSDEEEVAEEPRSRWVRASPPGKGPKVPLFPSLSASALKAKLRGRNRSAEEGTSPGDSKGAPPRDPHVQRSKSCKIPGLGGKPLALPPKPEKPPGSEASPPHWLQALKLKKKKP